MFIVNVRPVADVYAKRRLDVFVCIVVSAKMHKKGKTDLEVFLTGNR